MGELRFLRDEVAGSEVSDRVGTMKAKTIYLILCFVGVALPYWQFVPWVAANGLNLHSFMQQLFANRVSGFFAMDVVVSAVALLVFVRHENSRLRVPGRWLPLIAVLSVGVSLALPLYLYLREGTLEQERARPTTATV
ncbi:MAG: DUF2834 domain-containing protein [Candidatus Acidiferrales bacterium]